MQLSEGRSYAIASNSDIPGELAEGVADFALLGTDKLNELERPKRFTSEAIGTLACRFALLRPKGDEFKKGQEISVATTYPNSLRVFAEQEDIALGAVRKLSGKVERAPASGLTDAAFDIVETGNSLRANGLEIWREGEWLELCGVWVE